MVTRAILEELITILSFLVIENISVLGQEEGYTVKYTPLPRKEFPRAKPKGTREGKGVYLTVYPESSPNTDSISF